MATALLSTGNSVLR